jgi:serine/threonine protein kinase
VKQFPLKSNSAFDDEWDNLRQLAVSLTQHEHVLSFISIIVLEQEGTLAPWGGLEKNCHILMPLADMDLWRLLSYDSEKIQLNLSEVLKQSCFLLHGLEFLHQNLTVNGQSYNCTHGDLKPKNILVFDFRTPQYPVGHWRIADFGLSTIQSGKRTGEGPMTLPGFSPNSTFLNSASPPETGYHAPEKKFSPGGDIWSMGCINFWVLFRVLEDASRLREMDNKRGFTADGQPGFGDDYFYRREPALVVNPHVMDWLTQPSITESSNGIITGWSKIITKMLVVEPKRRIGSSEAFKELATLLSQESGMSENHTESQQQVLSDTTQASSSHANFPLQESDSQMSMLASSALSTSHVRPRYIPPPGRNALVSAQEWEDYLQPIQEVSGTKILNWLSNFNYRERYELLLEKWHPGTLQRIFEQECFLDWSNSIENSDQDGITCPPVLWYYGGREFSFPC